MPKKAKELSAKAVRDLRHPGTPTRPVTYAVGGVDGLMMQCTHAGSKSWVLRTLVGGKRREIGLGGFPDVSLTEARERARDAKRQIRAGVDPVVQRREARAALMATASRKTFAQAVEDYLVTLDPTFRNGKHRKQWRSTIDTYAAPVIGDTPVDAITLEHIEAVLTPIWAKKNETASRLRGRIEAVLAYATTKRWRSGDNPARWKGHLDNVLPKPSRVQKKGHQPALRLTDAPAWFADVRSREGMATRALEFLAMTAARSGEVRGATWDEIDLGARLWTIPAARMKANNEHRVTLTDEAVALLKALPRMAGNPLVFPAARGGPLSDMSLSACMRRINEAREGGYLDPKSGRPAVPHGIRSTFRDWVADCTDYPGEMAEIALAHHIGTKTELAYRRGDMMEKRRAMMADWCAVLMGRGA